jgi:tripartite-type tricarboxylate transporter receptor subunit TctC
MRIARFCTALLALTIMAPASARSEGWPTRPIRFIVPFPPGGSTDVSARIVAEYLSRDLGHQVFVENRSGANGNIGIEAAARSAPDGHTLLVGTDAVAVNPHTYRMSVDVLKDLSPVVELSRQPIVLAAHPSLGVKSIAELVALARQQPGMRYATGSGVGSLQHMVVQWFAQIAGIKLEQVPYRGGAPAITDLIAGHVVLGSLGSTPLIPYYKAGTLHMLAQSMKTRSTSLPDVPTFEEAGMKGLVIEQWLGVFAPGGTPASTVVRLNAEINKALADPAVRDNFQKASLEPVGGSVEQFAGFFRDDFDKFARLVKELNIPVN